MQYRDISTDTNSIYRLKEQEQVVFFLFNRSGDITIELAAPGATAHVFAFYSRKRAWKQSLTLTQKHLAPDTVSSALVKAALGEASSFSYHGTILIEKAAHRSEANQESRALLLSPEARAEARPTLEILAHDVKCHHAATTAPLNPESLYFAKSRGLTETQAEELFTKGFFNEAVERMNDLGAPIDGIEERITE